uniref:Basic leucine zipper transcription factor, ATF-like 3 n=1 Tax=Iconisemion striatum TaxID=60296 RepID=A0A1A7XP28_9TELE
MPLLFMDTGYEPSSPSGSLSAEEVSSNLSGPERDGEGRPRGTKRRQKNRDAARKSRRKQTERADELHEEFQQLERENSALLKEIAVLKKDVQRYETALERHKPHCCLGGSCSPAADCTASPSPPLALNSSTPPLSTSLHTKVGFQTFSYTKQINLPSPAPASASTKGPTSSSSSASSPSSSLMVPYSASFSTQPAPHSLFSDPPIPPHSAQLQPDLTLESLAGDMFLDSSFAASSKEHPHVSRLGSDSTRVVKPSCPVNDHRLYHLSGNPNGTREPLRPPPPQYHQAVSGLPSPADVLYGQQLPGRPESLLSMLTVPSPLNVPPATSCTFDGSLFQPAPLPPLPDPSKDYSLSEFLEYNDWILSGTGNQ